MGLFVNGVLTITCGTVAAVGLIVMSSTVFLSLAALWRVVLGKTPWPGPEPTVLYLITLVLVPLVGAVFAGRYMYSTLQPPEAPKRRRLMVGAALGLAGWLVVALVLMPFVVDKGK